jgi:CxxC-x17-CxxC domain-containing protein
VGDGERRGRRRERPRFETSCQACGAAAVVPFEPGPERPAFCKPCYESKKVELGLGPGRTLKRAVPAPVAAPQDEAPAVVDAPAE